MDLLAIPPLSTIVGGAMILILLVFVVGLCISKKKKNQRNASIKSDLEAVLAKKDEEEEEQQTDLLDVTSPEPGSANYDDDELEIYGKMEIKEQVMKIGADHYTLGEKISTGSYAAVHKAMIEKGDKSIAVAAKLPKSNTEQIKKYLTARLNFMAHENPRHVNVISLVAVDTTVPIMFLDLCETGTLSSWVKSLKHFTPEIDELMIRFCLDIANGLKQLHSIKVLHRRLGVRNVLLKNTTVRLIAKLTGFGPLEAEIDSASGKQGKVPFKWLPPESIERLPGQPRTYNEAVDMWSYGVTLWEMYSKGEMPFKQCNSWQLQTLLTGGERLPCPKECLPSMYEKVMLKCWELKPSERPKASEICTTLSKLFLGDSEKDYYYATGQIHEEEIECYAYSGSRIRPDVDAIYQNNPTDTYMNAMISNENEYLEVKQQQDTYVNTNQLSKKFESSGQYLNAGCSQTNQKKSVDPIYLQVIG